MANIDPRAFDETQSIDAAVDRGIEELTRPAEDYPPKYLPPMQLDETDEATRLASLDSLAAMERVRGGPSNDERTRAVNIRNDPSISDIDWDLD